MYHRKLWVQRDRLKRKNMSHLEVKRCILKSLVASSKETIVSKYYYSKLYTKMPKKESISFFRNHCHRSGSGRSVFRLFKYSRHECKRLAAKGLLQGMRKSSF